MAAEIKGCAVTLNCNIQFASIFS